MKYLCLVYAEEKKLDALPTAERQKLVDESMEYMDVLRKEGHYIASNALQRVQEAATIRNRDGKTFTTDGPFAETREQLGGFILIEAPDLTDAVGMMSKFPVVRAGIGCLEVRPVRELVHS